MSDFIRLLDNNIIIQPGDIFAVHDFDDESSILELYLQAAAEHDSPNRKKLSSDFTYFTAASLGYGSGSYTLESAIFGAGLSYKVYRPKKSVKTLMNGYYSRPLSLP